MKKMFIIMIFTAIIAGCQNSDHKSGHPETELHVMAATSLTDALQEIEILYEKQYNHINLIINYASSGTLQKQIEQGAPADIFLSAGISQMENLHKKGFIKEETMRNYLKNELVLISAKDYQKEVNSFNDLTQQKIQSISLGQPETVPAGTYAKEMLQFLNLWETVQNKIIYGKDVRQVLTYVETKNVDAGIVYKTDALLSDNVTIIDEAPRNSHEPIVYPIAVLKNTEHSEEVTVFYEWLLQDDAFHIFQSYGFKGVNETSVQ